MKGGRDVDDAACRALGQGWKCCPAGRKGAHSINVHHGPEAVGAHVLSSCLQAWPVPVMPRAAARDARVACQQAMAKDGLCTLLAEVITPAPADSGAASLPQPCAASGWYPGTLGAGPYAPAFLGRVSSHPSQSCSWEPFIGSGTGQCWGSSAGQGANAPGPALHHHDPAHAAHGLVP